MESLATDTDVVAASTEPATSHLSRLDALTYGQCIAVGDTPEEAAAVVTSTFGLASMDYLDCRRAGVTHLDALVAVITPGVAPGYRTLRRAGRSHAEAMSALTMTNRAEVTLTDEGATVILRLVDDTR